MKKLVAMLIALSMLLSCTALAAPAGMAKQTTAQVYINPQLISGAPEEAATLVNTINSLVFTTTKGENYSTVAWGANGANVSECTVAPHEDGGLLFFSSLYPNTAILLDVTELLSLLQQVMPVEDMLTGFSGMGEQLEQLLAPYMADFSTLLAQMESEVLTDETGSSMYLSITSKHLGTLLEAWLKRFGNDQTLQSLVNEVLVAVSDGEYDPSEMSTAIQSLYEEALEMKNAEAMEIGSVGIFEQDGVNTLEITVLNNLLISMDAYAYEGMDCLDVLAVVAQDGTADWQATYDGIVNGTSYSDVMFGVSCASALGYDYMQVYMMEGGQVLSATLEENAANIDTDAEVVSTVLSVDMAQGDQTINIFGVAAETVLVPDQGMPSLEGKYVLDVMALPLDMLLNGLPNLAENIVIAMPEMVQMLIDQLAQVEGLEILQGVSVIPEAETATESLDEIGEETVPEVTAPAVSDDEIAPMEVQQTNTPIEDM